MGKVEVKWWGKRWENGRYWGELRGYLRGKWGENERRWWEIRVEMGKMENGVGWGEMGGIWGENENI